MSMEVGYHIAELRRLIPQLEAQHFIGGLSLADYTFVCSAYTILLYHPNFKNPEQRRFFACQNADALEKIAKEDAFYLNRQEGRALLERVVEILRRV